MRIERRNRLRHKGIYLLPNLLTTLALFFGFYAIVAALKGEFAQAAAVIFIAMVFDGLDGRIARMTNTASAFGAEYDSLSDMVTFGIAPALLAYKWGLFSLGKIGWLAAFMYVAATALRLARFNTQVETASKRYFQGLPCPAAAAVIASMIWTGNSAFDIGTTGLDLSIFLAVMTVLMALLMFSSVPYYSFKELDFKGKVPFIAIFVFILLCVAIAVDPSVVLCGGFLIFTISGPVIYVIKWKRKKRLLRRLFLKKSADSRSSSEHD